MRWVFWASALLIAYTYAGYAGWLWLWARLFPCPVLRAPQEPYVSIVMVVRNEERWLESKLRNLLELDYPQTVRRTEPKPFCASTRKIRECKWS
jgi:hypothetical protein